MRRPIFVCLAGLLLVPSLVSIPAQRVSAAQVTTFSNDTGITIQDSASPPTAASPYPSSLSVSGTTGVIVAMTVFIRELTHPNPDDLDILLVSPSLRPPRTRPVVKVMLMSDAGGTNDLSAVNVIFDDSGPALPDSSQITSDFYAPTDYDFFGVADTMPSPAPSEPYATTLSAFNGLDANGSWRLYVSDDRNGSAGLIDGWGLIITTDVAPTLNPIGDLSSRENQTGDIAISATDPDNPVTSLSYSLSGQPAFASLTDNGDGTANLALAPEPGDRGNYAGVTVTVTDGALSDSETFTITVIDGVGPTTTAALDPSANAAGWNTGSTQVALTAADDPGGVGVKNITYSSAGAQTIPSTVVSGDTAAFFITSPGETTVSFFATDTNDNVELTNTQIVRIDGTAPTTTAALDPLPNAAGWNKAAVTVTLTAADTGDSDVDSVTYSTTGAQIIGSSNIAGNTASVVISKAGTTTVSFFATDVAGNVESAQTVVVKLDLRLPVVTAPVQRFIKNTRLGLSTVPTLLQWTASDAGSGLKSIELREKINSDPVHLVSLPSPTAKSIIRSLTPGNTYEYRVRANDRADWRSLVAIGDSFSLNSFQEDDPAVDLSANNWTPTAAGDLFDDGAVLSRIAGATATFSFRGTNVAWIASMGPNRGRARVILDGDTANPVFVDLYAPSRTSRLMVYVRNGLDPSVTHTVQITVLGTKTNNSTATTIEVDAVIAID